MKIIFHIGLTKTGTTSIQRFLDINSEKLVELGICYPQFDDIDAINYRTSGNGYGLCLEVLAKNINPEVLKKSIFIWINKQVEHAKKLNCTQLIISSETFCTLPEDIFRSFLSFLPRNDFNYEFILCTREPYAWFFSSWLQSVKREGNGKWLDECLEDLDFSLQPLAKEQILKSCESLNSIYLINYDTSRNNLIGEFVSFLGLNEDQRKNLDFDVAKINRSITEEEFLLLFWTNKFSGGNVELSEELHSLIIDTAPSKPFFFISPYAQRKVYQYCDSKKIKYSKIYYADKVITSEEKYFDLSSIEEKNYIKSLKKIIFFYRSLFQKTRALAVHKVNISESSQYKELMPNNFDLFTYLILNEDVLYSHIDPYKHYYEYGVKDNRVYSLKDTANN